MLRAERVKHKFSSEKEGIERALYSCKAKTLKDLDEIYAQVEGLYEIERFCSTIRSPIENYDLTFANLFNDKDTSDLELQFESKKFFVHENIIALICPSLLFHKTNFADIQFTKAVSASEFSDFLQSVYSRKPVDSVFREKFPVLTPKTMFPAMSSDRVLGIPDIQVPVHSLLLGMRCKLFKRKFRSIPQAINMPEFFDEDSLYAFVACIYELKNVGSLREITSKSKDLNGTVKKLYSASLYFEFSMLEDACLNYFFSMKIHSFDEYYKFYCWSLEHSCDNSQLSTFFELSSLKSFKSFAKSKLDEIDMNFLEKITTSPYVNQTELGISKELDNIVLQYDQLNRLQANLSNLSFDPDSLVSNFPRKLPRMSSKAKRIVSKVMQEKNVEKNNFHQMDYAACADHVRQRLCSFLRSIRNSEIIFNTENFENESLELLEQNHFLSLLFSFSCLLNAHESITLLLNKRLLKLAFSNIKSAACRLVNLSEEYAIILDSPISYIHESSLFNLEDFSFLHSTCRLGIDFLTQKTQSVSCTSCYQPNNLSKNRLYFKNQTPNISTSLAQRFSSILSKREKRKTLLLKSKSSKSSLQKLSAFSSTVNSREKISSLPDISANYKLQYFHKSTLF